MIRQKNISIVHIEIPFVRCCVCANQIEGYAFKINQLIKVANKETYLMSENKVVYFCVDCMDKLIEIIKEEKDKLLLDKL